VLGYRLLGQGEEGDERLAQRVRADLIGAQLRELGHEPRRHLLVLVTKAGQNVGQRAFDSTEAKISTVGECPARGFASTIGTG
jgi:hypothetical protein